MDKTALFNLSYGLYIIGAKDGEREVGCVVNTVVQSTSSPLTLTVCINKDNYTNECIKRTDEFTVSILSEETKQTTIGVFGFSSSRDKDKFAEVPSALTPAGLPYVAEGVTSYLQCRVLSSLDNFTHTIFVAEVIEAENLSKEPPMTYAYYHRVLKGKTPPKASSFVAGTEETTVTKTGYACSVCGYEYPGNREEFEQLPDDYVCPICKMPKSKFVLQT